MNKIRLALIAVLTISSVQAQSAWFFYQSYPPPILTFPAPEQHIRIATANPDEIDGNNYYADAERKEEKGDLNDALTLFGKAAFEYNIAQLKSRYANALMRMSNLHMLLKNYKAAEDMILNVVLKTYTRIGSKTGEMNAYKQLGKIYFGANKLPQSMWFFSQQGILARQLSNKTAYIESVLDIARIKIKKKQFVLATADVNRAEILARSAKTIRFNKDILETRKIISHQSSVFSPKS